MTYDKTKHRVRLHEVIANTIQKQIITRGLKPGDTLPSESELMEQFGAGKHSVREALRVLETQGLITVQQGSRKGPIITRPPKSLVSDLLQKAILFGEVPGRLITQFRLALEPSIAEIAASSNIDPKIISDIEENIRSARKLHAKNKTIIDTSTKFHILLAEATKNPLFTVIVTALLTTPELVKRIKPIPRHELDEPTIEHHARIFEAIKAGDPVQAALAMKQHILTIDEFRNR
jgi:GntR family transcriptional repressor for pyruvate dehydrogenase complex